MIVLIDTSSLLALVRYYLPFDNKNRLLNYFKQKIVDKEIIVLDKVYEESKLIDKGIILSKLDFLNNRAFRVKTTDLLPDQKYFNQLENQFCYGRWRNELTSSEFESRKNEFLNSADSKLLLYCIQNKDKVAVNEKMVIVTEETKKDNDNKAFKKLPAICDILQIEHYTLPELIGMYNDLNIEFP